MVYLLGIFGENMKIDLSEAKNHYGKVFETDIALKVDDDCFDSNLCIPKNLLKLHLKYCYQQDGVEVEGAGNIPLEYYCTRCAEPFDYDLEFSFSELFKEENGENSEEDDYFFKQDVLILDKCLRDSIILATPQNLKCRQDCKGVCPYCYANLNQTECDCELKMKQDSNPFNVLKGL